MASRTIMAVAASLLVACGGNEDMVGPVKARNLTTGEIQTFASRSDIPADWAACADEACTVPPQVPCDALGVKVCTLQPQCRLKTLWCMGTTSSDGASSDSSSASDSASPGSGETCEYACIPQLPLLCEELTDQKSCGARPDCDWLQGACPAIACQPGQECPGCPSSCQAKQPPVCTALDEQTCKARSDCQWDVPQVCPACIGGPECDCKPSCKPATKPPACSPSDCGPAPAMPSTLCSDGKTVAGPTGKCLPAPTTSSTSTAKCAWEVVTCPEAPATCVRTGCSGTICANQAKASTCEWSDYYQCYNLAVCGVTNGSCGWIQTPDFVACLAKYGKKP